MNQDNIDFCNYLQPIINSSSGFIKTNGYMSHIPGTILMMSEDEMVFSIINIPIIYDKYIYSSINSFLGLKDDESKSDMIKNIYFTGSNIKNNHLLSYYNNYFDIDNKLRCIYYEPDCYNILGFEDISSNVNISKINVIVGQRLYRIPASKSITPLNKADSASLRIYETNNKEISIVKYTVFKKKFKLSVDIFFNIITL